MDLDINNTFSQGTFTCFPTLPAELREIIILLAIHPKSRYFGHSLPSERDHNNMHLSWVTHEFRIIYLSIYTKMFDEMDYKNPVFQGLPPYAMLPYQSLQLCPTYKNRDDEVTLLKQEACAKFKHVVLELVYEKCGTIAMAGWFLRKCVKEFERFDNLETLRIAAIGIPESILPFSEKMRLRKGLEWRPEVKVTVVGSLDDLYRSD